MMKYPTLFLFLCFTLPAISQIKTRHHMGLSFGVDPASAILMLLNRDDSDNTNYEDDESEDDGSYGAFAVYYKYKPLSKWDFDAGAKLGLANYGELTYIDSDINTSMKIGSNYGFFTAINYSTRNPFSKHSNNPFFSSLEIGWASAPGDLQIHNTKTDETKIIDNLNGSIYFEGKAGMKFGWENNAAGLFLAVNNMINTRSADRELRQRGLGQLPRIGVAILFGITYEFGFRKKERKKKAETNYPDWFQPEDEKY